MELSFETNHGLKDVKGPPLTGRNAFESEQAVWDPATPIEPEAIVAEINRVIDGYGLLPHEALVEILGSEAFSLSQLERVYDRCYVAVIGIKTAGTQIIPNDVEVIHAMQAIEIHLGKKLGKAGYEGC